MADGTCRKRKADKPCRPGLVGKSGERDRPCESMYMSSVSLPSGQNQLASHNQLLGHLYNAILLLLIVIYFKYLFFPSNLMSHSLLYSGVGVERQLS